MLLLIFQMEPSSKFSKSRSHHIVFQGPSNLLTRVNMAFQRRKVLSYDAAASNCGQAWRYALTDFPY